MTTYLKGHRDQVADLLAASADGDPTAPDLAQYDRALSVETQTDKELVKVVPCTGCARPLVVNTFYAPAIAKCASCGGQSKTASAGQAKIVQAGRTDPSKAANLDDTLINRQFAHAVCPLDPEHTMELKSVTHNPNYGPSRLLGYDGKGQPKYRTETGEIAMHQCLECKCVVTYSTTSVMQYARQNEPKKALSGPSWGTFLHTRDEAA